MSDIKENNIMQNENKTENWFKKHTDTVVVMSGLLAAIVWITAQTNSLKQDLHSIDHRLTVIETVMVMKNILPHELCKGTFPEKENKS